MPLIAHNTLPTFERLEAEGVNIAPAGTAADLRIGFLNMLMDAALTATERQFLRLLAVRDDIAVRVSPFSLPGLPRDAVSSAHMDAHYDSFETVRDAGLDAIVVTGINVADPRLENLTYLDEIFEVLDWAGAELKSSLYSCLATHAVMQFRYGRRRSPMKRKLWGVYPHRVVDPEHPLCAGLPAVLDVPQSRWNDISRDQYASAGLRVLIEERGGCVNMACSEDGLKEIHFQGHPEYDAVSLLKEYKRELRLHAEGTRADRPPLPENILPPCGAEVLASGGPETLEPSMRETWLDGTRLIFGNWLGMLRDR